MDKYLNLNGLEFLVNYTKDQIDNLITNYSNNEKNKLYNPSVYSGMGKLILGENIQNGINILTQSMFYDGQSPRTNTIFVIQLDYDLNDPSDQNPITIPDNCTLLFEGGSISNGKIILQNTKLDGDVKWNNVIISGSCTNEVLTPQMFGAYPTLNENENNKTQHTLAFLNMLSVFHNVNTISTTIYISSGHYAINSSLYINKDCSFCGENNNTILDIYSGKGIHFGCTNYNNAFDNCCLILDYSLSEDTVKRDTKIKLTSVEGLNVNDYLILTDTLDGSFHNSRSYFRNSEIVRISEIDITEGNTVYISERLFEKYYASFGDNFTTTLPDVTYRTIISKYTPKKLRLCNFSIYSHSHDLDHPSPYSLYIIGLHDSVISNINITNYGNESAMCVYLGLNFKIENSQIRSYSLFPADSYGLQIGNSQSFIVSNTLLHSTGGHAIATGGSNNKFCVVNRCFTYEKLQIETKRIDEDNVAHIDIDSHANCEFHKYINIQAPHATCDLGGFHITVESCNLHSISTTFTGGNFLINKCRLNRLESLELLIYNQFNNEKINNIIICDSVFCSTLKYNGQINSSDLESKKSYETFIFKNNICEGLKFRNGVIDNVIIEDNIFNNNGIYFTNVKLNNILIQSNIITEGSIVFWGITHLYHGIIQCNQITLSLTNPPLINEFFPYTIALINFNGSILSNIINRNMSISNSSYRKAIVLRNSVVSVLHNNFSTIEEYDTIVYAEMNSQVICKNNTRKLANSNMSYVSANLDGSSIIDDKNYRLVSDLRIFGNLNGIGTPIYFENENKLGYVASKAGNELLRLTSISSTNPYIGENIFNINSVYIMQATGSGDHRLYFSKYNDITNPNFESGLLNVITSLGYRSKVFKGVDQTIYPYIYVTTTVTNAGSTYIIFNDNIYLCDYDGAKYNIIRKGTTSNRPNGYDIYVGFRYFDTTLEKPIYAKNISINNVVTWVDATGATV